MRTLDYVVLVTYLAGPAARRIAGSLRRNAAPGAEGGKVAMPLAGRQMWMDGILQPGPRRRF